MPADEDLTPARAAENSPLCTYSTRWRKRSAATHITHEIAFASSTGRAGLHFPVRAERTSIDVRISVTPASDT